MSQTRRHFITMAAAGAFAASGAEARSRSRRRAGGPRFNILLMVTDQQTAYRDIPAAVPLPNQERLRRIGVEFENFYANTAPCGPSRSVMYTGQHTQKTRVIANPNTNPFPFLSPEIDTIGDMLRACGYTTHYKGKWHLSLTDDHSERALLRRSHEDFLEPYGFSDFNLDHDPHGRTWTGFEEDRVTAAAAVGLLKQMSARSRHEPPWFLAVNFVNPHDIMFFDATGKQEKTRIAPGLIAPLKGAPDHPLYQADWDVPLPASFHDDLSTKPKAQSEERRALDAIYGKMPRSDERAWKRFRSYYFNCLRDADAQIGAVLEALETFAQADRTIVLFTSDHGERAGAHGLRQKGNSIYRENLGVPFVVVHPDVGGGFATASLGSSVDMAPTLLRFAGATNYDRWPALAGIGLDDAVAAPNRRTKRDDRGILLNYGCIYGWDIDALVGRLNALAHAKPYGGPPDSRSNRALFRGVHDGRYKFARYFAPADHHQPDTWRDLTSRNDLELYDLDHDPHEMRNLAASPEENEDLILSLNAKLNALIAAEIGVDDGREFGPA